MPELSVLNFLIIYGWSLVILWLAAVFQTSLSLWKQPVLGLNEQATARSETLVSIIVPARNEAGRVLEKSVSSILRQNYGSFEMIVLDDRSTDETGRILENIKSRNSTTAFRIIKGDELPDGWLGKPHALEQAFRHARGEWILSTDADIVFAPETLVTAIAYAKAEDLDALALLPRQICGSFWERLFMPVFTWFNILKMPLHRVNDPNRPESMGVGNFFMLRRTLLEELDGFACVRNQVAEDLELAALIKQQGYRLGIASAPDLIETRMYEGFRAIWHGFSKNLFPAMKYSIPKTVLGALAVFLFGVLPVFCAFAAFLTGQFPLFVPFLVAYLLQVLVFVILRTHLAENPFYALLTPFGLLIFVSILINSMLKILSGKGVNWKDRTIYSQRKISSGRQEEAGTFSKGAAGKSDETN